MGATEKEEKGGSGQTSERLDELEAFDASHRRDHLGGDGTAGFREKKTAGKYRVEVEELDLRATDLATIASRSEIREVEETKSARKGESERGRNERTHWLSRSFVSIESPRSEERSDLVSSKDRPAVSEVARAKKGKESAIKKKDEQGYQSRLVADEWRRRE